MDKVTVYSERLGKPLGGYFPPAKVEAKDNAPFIQLEKHGKTITLSFTEASALIQFIDQMEIIWGPKITGGFK